MTLEQVLAGAPLSAALPPVLRGRLVEGLDYDSRRIQPNYLFFAFAGKQADGRAFARQALEKGALAVVSDLPPLEAFDGPWIQAAPLRVALSIAARNFYHSPDERICLTGITGTNGKTTTSYLCDALLRAAGHTTALVGTIEYVVGERRQKAPNTTPESLDIYRLLAELEQRGGRHAVLEVSSHALALGRVHGMRFHTAVFTNLSQDHLDFHRTMEEYFAAKEELFRGENLPAPRWAVLNADDAWCLKLRLHPATDVIWYSARVGGKGKSGEREGIRIAATRVTSSFAGLEFEVSGPGFSVPVRSPLSGRFNVYNLLAAFGVGLSYGLEPEQVAQGVAACGKVPGRFERVDQGQPFLVAVDYAHTEDALQNLILAARELGPRRIITVFGCGGDRDRTKRPLMGQTAARLSDYVVLTSDNPRSEDPLAIINDVLVGLRRTDVPHLVEPDRRKAIHKALEEARAGDIVLIAGKGHETYQVLKAGTIHFDDREEAAAALRRLGYPGGQA